MFSIIGYRLAHTLTGLRTPLQLLQQRQPPPKHRLSNCYALPSRCWLYKFAVDLYNLCNAPDDPRCATLANCLTISGELTDGFISRLDRRLEMLLISWCPCIYIYSCTHACDECAMRVIRQIKSRERYTECNAHGTTWWNASDDDTGTWWAEIISPCN